MQLGDIVNTGEEIDALVSERLIENIFFKNSPLHDGAMIISGMKIRAAGCLLPVAHDQDIPNWLGLRHRAALGITQVSDAMSIVVSEETGGITVARQGSLSLDITSDELDRLLIEVLSE
jgi:DNA integrity scanning protein DisA with diadenylate cyclase activity